MKQYLTHLSERLRASFWLVPAVMMAAAMALAFLLLELDARTDLSSVEGLRWLRMEDPDSARALLSAIAGSTIAVAGTVFSITIVALTLASNQFGPRLVRNFMRDRGTQIALGIFLSNFVYALMAMRGINSVENAHSTHEFTVNGGIVLALISIAFLIYFIHNVAQSIQADNVTHHINREFRHALDQLYPSAREDDPHSSRVDLDELELGANRMEITSKSGGYVQMINRRKLIEWASEHNCCIRLECYPGVYIAHWRSIATVFEPPRKIDSAEIAAAIQPAVGMGPQPTSEADIVYSIRQLAQIAVRALSPGINDPFTAYSCIDRLVDGIGNVLQRPRLPNCFHDEEGNRRLITRELDFADLLAAALDEIREYGRDSGVVMRHLLNSLVDLAPICNREEDKRALKRYLERLAEDCRNFVEDKFDSAAIEEKISRIEKLLSG